MRNEKLIAIRYGVRALGVWACGCNLLTPAQSTNVESQVQSAAVGAAGTLALQAQCTQVQITSTTAAWMVANPGKTPTATQLQSWGEMALAHCVLTYPMNLVPAAAPTPAAS